MSKEFKNLLIKDINLMYLGLELLKKELNNNIEDDDISGAVKEKIALLHTSTELMTERFAPEHLNRKKENQKERLHTAKNKIRELEDKMGKETSIADIPTAAAALTKCVREKMLKEGLYVSPSVSIVDYGINITIEHIKMDYDKPDYVRSEESLKEINLANAQHKESFHNNFDNSDLKDPEKIKMSSKNIEFIESLMSDVNGLLFELTDVSSGEFSDDFNSIEKMSFYYSMSSNSFPKMYFGD